MQIMPIGNSGLWITEGQEKIYFMNSKHKKALVGILISAKSLRQEVLPAVKEDILQW